METDNILIFFDKNKYDVNNKIKNNKIVLNKEECLYEAINNNYEGFKYEGDHNQCYLFNSDKFDNNMNNDFKHWNRNTYIKNKATIDIENMEDTNKYSSHFTQINNNGYFADNLINKSIVQNEDECLFKCIKEKDNCKSLIYLDQPKKCDFFKKKIMKKNNNSNKDYDIYTINNNNINKYSDKIQYLLNENKNKINLSNNSYIEHSNENNEIYLYNCNGLMSTDPFCKKEFNENEKKKLINYSDCVDINNINNKYYEEKLFNNACKNKYGNEYVYDNDISNIENIINCENGSKKVKCKIQFINNNLIEKFNNLEDIEKNNRIILLLLFFILFLIIIYKLFNINLK